MKEKIERGERTVYYEVINREKLAYALAIFTYCILNMGYLLTTVRDVQEFPFLLLLIDVVACMMSGMYLYFVLAFEKETKRHTFKFKDVVNSE